MRPFNVPISYKSAFSTRKGLRLEVSEMTEMTEKIPLEEQEQVAGIEGQGTSNFWLNIAVPLTTFTVTVILFNKYGWWLTTMQ